MESACHGLIFVHSNVQWRVAILILPVQDFTLPQYGILRPILLEPSHQESKSLQFVIFQGNMQSILISNCHSFNRMGTEFEKFFQSIKVIFCCCYVMQRGDTFPSFDTWKVPHQFLEADTPVRHAHFVEQGEWGWTHLD